MSAATERLVQYNGRRYHPVDNPYGLDGTGGLDANMVRLLTDLATAANDTAALNTTAGQQAVIATNKAAEAGASATAAFTSETNAKTSENAAKASENAAKTSENNAKTSENTVNADKTTISGWRTEVSTWRQDVSGWRTEISGWRTDVSGWRTEVSDNAATVNTDKGVVAQYKTDTYNYMVAAQTAATNAQTWNPANYVAKRGMTSYTFQTLDLDTLNEVYEVRYIDATNSPNAPDAGAGYGYYVGLAGGDAGGNLGLQMLVTQNGLMFMRDKYNGNWLEIWHSDRLPVTCTGGVVDFPLPPTVAGQPLGGGSGSVSLTRHFLSM